MMIDLQNALSGFGGGTMETWTWRVKEEKENFWLYESRSSKRWVPKDEFISLLHGIKEYLVLEEGDIVFRNIFEQYTTENIVFFSNGQFDKREGYTYRNDQGYVIDSDHPFVDEIDDETKEKYLTGQLKHTQRPEHYHELFWTVKEIDDDATKKRLERERELEATRRRFRSSR
jgi:hypothetical protein